jgi:hypothetical protein
VRAFVTANARAVLATYWKVPASESSDAFIRAFYASGRTGTIGAALRDAQLAAMKRPETSHPYYWGAYFLVGDASKSMLTPAPATGRGAVTLAARPVPVLLAAVIACAGVVSVALLLGGPLATALAGWSPAGAGGRVRA